MTSGGIDFSPDLSVVQRALRAAGPALMKLEGPNRRVSIILDRFVQRNFRSEGGLVGGWTPFKLGGRRLRGGGIDRSAKLLQDTGALRLSFAAFWSAKEAGIGSDLSYAVFHNDGTETLPARRMLPTDSDVGADVREVYVMHAKTFTGRKLW